jgi:hypothetical protein
LAWREESAGAAYPRLLRRELAAARQDSAASALFKMSDARRVRRVTRLNEGVVLARIYVKFGILTYSHSLDFTNDRRAAFSIVLVGNQIA